MSESVEQTVDKSNQLIARQNSEQSNQQNSEQSNQQNSDRSNQQNSDRSNQQNSDSFFTNFGQTLGNIYNVGYNMGCNLCKELSGVDTKSISESNEVIVEPKPIQTPRYTLVIEKTSTVSSGIEVEDRQTMEFGSRQSAEEYVSRVGLPIGCHYYIKDPEL